MTRPHATRRTARLTSLTVECTVGALEEAFAVASREVLFDETFVPAASPHANHDVSPDGRRLLVLEAAERAQLFVVHDWGAEVRARLSGRAPPR